MLLTKEQAKEVSVKITATAVVCIEAVIAVAFVIGFAVNMFQVIIRIAKGI